MPYYSTTIEQSSSSRLTLSTELLSALAWNNETQEIEIYGFFRKPGELLCAPKQMQGPEDEPHPFASVIRRVEELRSAPAAFLLDVPSAADLLLPNRLKVYQASWVGTGQLNLKLGEQTLHGLGRVEKKSLYHAIAYGQILVLMSPAAYQAALAADFQQSVRLP